MCLELLRDYILRPGARVLDVGSGSGYLSACMAVMLQQNNIAGKVFGIEHMEPLVEQSIININKGNADLFSSGILNVRGTLLPLYMHTTLSPFDNNITLSWRWLRRSARRRTV